MKFPHEIKKDKKKAKKEIKDAKYLLGESGKKIKKEDEVKEVKKPFSTKEERDITCEKLTKIQGILEDDYQNLKTKKSKKTTNDLLEDIKKIKNKLK